jgi:hypothetical protein
MRESDIRVAVETRLKTNIDTLDALYPNLFELPVTWENTPNRTDAFWIRTYLTVTDSRSGTIGVQDDPNAYIKHQGLFVVSIFTKLNIGLKQSSDIVNDITALFQNKTFEGVWTQVPTPRKIGDDEHGYYHVNVLIPFTTVS